MIHLHNVRYFLSPLIIQRLHRLKPTVKFCHDTRLFCLNNGKKVLPTNQVCQLPMGINCFIKRCCSRNNKGGTNLDLRSNLLKIWEKMATRNLDKIIAGSRYMYSELMRNGFSERKVVINPLYTEKTDISSTCGKPSDEKTILWIGRFNHPLAIEQKGFTQMINALKYLKGNGWKTVVVGEGEYIESVKKQVKDSGLANKVDFAGGLSSEEIDTYYQKSTMVVMTPMYPESFGLIGIEAMAFGKPVVAFDTGGVREWLKHEETGFLVERGDIRELARRMVQLLENPALALSLGKKGMGMVNKKFRKKDHMETLINIYQEVIEHRSNSRV